MFSKRYEIKQKFAENSSEASHRQYKWVNLLNVAKNIWTYNLQIVPKIRMHLPNCGENAWDKIL